MLASSLTFRLRLNNVGVDGRGGEGGGDGDGSQVRQLGACGIAVLVGKTVGAKEVGIGRVDKAASRIDADLAVLGAGSCTREPAAIGCATPNCPSPATSN